MSLIRFIDYEYHEKHVLEIESRKICKPFEKVKGHLDSCQQIFMFLVCEME